MKNVFPRLLRFALKALAHEKRQEIVSYLLEVKEATPREIREKLGMKRNELAYHMTQLMIGNIVERVIEGGKVKYRLSMFGVRLLHNIFAVLEPPSREREKGFYIDLYEYYKYVTTRDEVYSLAYPYAEQSLATYSTSTTMG